MIHNKQKRTRYIVSVAVLIFLFLISFSSILFFNTVFIVLVAYMACKLALYLINEFNSRNSKDKLVFSLRVVGYIILLIIVGIYFHR